MESLLNQLTHEVSSCQIGFIQSTATFTNSHNWILRFSWNYDLRHDSGETVSLI